MGCAVPLQKTHSISFECRLVRYPWHRWYGRDVLTRKAGGAHAAVAYFCKLPEAAPDVMLVEIPKWMFDAGHCATMQLTNRPHVDCATLRTLKSSIAEQRVSAPMRVLQPQLAGQAGQGDRDDDDSQKRAEIAVGVVRRTTDYSSLERSQPIHTLRSGKTSGAIARRCSDEQARVRPPRSRRTR